VEAFDVSIEEPMVLGCPKCGQTKEVMVWSSLNADVSPEARASLLEGTINLFECEACEESFVIDAPLLYHDMSRRFLVQYYPFGALEDPEFVARFDQCGRETANREVARKGPVSAVAGYLGHSHIVFSMDELVRYVLFRERVFDSRANAPRFFVAGFPYHAGPKLIHWLNVGEMLRLVREPDNPHDARAVAIYYEDDRIGYVPRNQNHNIAGQLDQGKWLDCRIKAINADEEAYDVLEVEVVPAIRNHRTRSRGSPVNDSLEMPPVRLGKRPDGTIVLWQSGWVTHPELGRTHFLNHHVIGPGWKCFGRTYEEWSALPNGAYPLPDGYNPDDDYAPPELAVPEY
jgi:hypothetical protein